MVGAFPSGPQVARMSKCMKYNYVCQVVLIYMIQKRNNNQKKNIVSFFLELSNYLYYLAKIGLSYCVVQKGILVSTFASHCRPCTASNVSDNKTQVLKCTHFYQFLRMKNPYFKVHIATARSTTVHSLRITSINLKYL